MSIVLVIIGLIVGGVVVGRSLISTSEIRAQITQLESFKTAMFAFKNKYNCSAGDCGAASTYGLGGNGDADGHVCIYYAYCTAPGEYIKLWQNLSLAGLLDGNFSGARADGSYYGALAGNNIPETKIKGGGVFYGASNFGTWTSDQFRLVLAAMSGNYGGDLLTPAQAQELDLKIDDGLPNTGQVLGTSLSLAYYYGTNFQTCRPNEGTNIYVTQGVGATMLHDI